MAGWPVELNVATSLLEILALFPTPATISLPLEEEISLIALIKSSSILSPKFSICCWSIYITSRAILLIWIDDFMIK